MAKEMVGAGFYNDSTLPTLVSKVQATAAWQKVESLKADADDAGEVSWLLAGKADQPQPAGYTVAKNLKFFFPYALVADGIAMDIQASDAHARIRIDNDGEVDAFNNHTFEDTSGQLPWDEISTIDKIMRVLWLLTRLVVVIAMLYMFIASLSFLADAFRLVAGKEAGEVFRNSDLLTNPIAGLVIGVLATVLVQSSSTSTSIIISMVAADLLKKESAIFIIMGANIGTSVTSTIVALGQSTHRTQFIRAFAAATIHDAFNFLTVIVFLPLEWATGYLDTFSREVVAQYGEFETDEGAKKEYLKKLTKDFTKMVSSLNKKLIKEIALEQDPDVLAELEKETLLKDCWIKTWGFGDRTTGTIFLFFSLAILCICLFVIVKVLQSILKGRLAVLLHKTVNGKLPDLKVGNVTIPFSGLTGYLAMFVGLGVTIGVQSSSITTSVLTPLVGLGVIDLETVYPVVLGANIGTTMTAVLAALASDADKIGITLEVAYCHLFFNLSGIILFYVIWPLRIMPITMAKYMGQKTAKYKWYAVMYLFMCFFVIPLLLVALSLWSIIAMGIVVGIFVVFCVFIGLLCIAQSRYPDKLPPALRTMEFLPVFMRSLEPLDNVLSKLSCCPKNRTRADAEDMDRNIENAKDRLEKQWTADGVAEGQL